MTAEQAGAPDILRRARRQEEKRVRVLLKQEHDNAHRERQMGFPGPTPETRRKFVPHAIETLQDRGVIDASQAAMLDQIARAYSLLTAGTGIRLSTWERVDGGRIASNDMPGDVRLIRHYAAWWDHLKNASLQRAMPIVIDVAVDGLSFNQIARRRRCDKRTAKNFLMKGLQCWAEAGRKKCHLSD